MTAWCKSIRTPYPGWFVEKIPEPGNGNAVVPAMMGKALMGRALVVPNEEVCEGQELPRVMMGLVQ